MGKSFASMRIFATSPYTCTLFLRLFLRFLWDALASCSYGQIANWEPYLHWWRISFWGITCCLAFFLGKQIHHCLWIFYVRPSVSPENNPAVFYLIVSVLKARWFQLNLLLLLSNLGFTFAFHWLRCPCNWTPLVSFLQRTKLEIGYGGGHFLVLKEFV